MSGVLPLYNYTDKKGRFGKVGAKKVGKPLRLFWWDRNKEWRVGGCVGSYSVLRK
jgi:hypothetical protein